MRAKSLVRSIAVLSACQQAIERLSVSHPFDNNLFDLAPDQALSHSVCLSVCLCVCLSLSLSKTLSLSVSVSVCQPP
jgi:hypothetical protein